MSVTISQPAHAKYIGQHSSVVTVASGSWGSQPTAMGGNGSTNAYSITWTGSANKQYALFSLINVGTFPLTNGRFTFSTLKTSGSGTGAPNLIFDLCSGVWDATTFLCSGAIATIGASTGGTLVFAQNININARVDIRITHNRTSSGNYITTINAIARRDDVRLGTVFRS